MTSDPLIIGHGYILEGMAADKWDRGHPVYGTPEVLAGKYLGYLQGERRWHGFEIWVDGAEQGVIFMPDRDLAQLTITDVSALGDEVL